MRCPANGSTGSAVAAKTVKALLTTSALRRFEPGDYRFCADSACAVVYFDGFGHCFETSDIRVPVSQKDPDGARLICYCFDESEASIRAEIAATGGSQAVERVRDHIAAGRCACDLRNPRGTCCLGDLHAAIERLTAQDT
jgi:hypothetical protein